MNNNQNGNALLYVLIAVGLMAALTYAVTRDNSGQQADRMDDTRADLYATELLSHISSAEQVIYHMTQWGVNVEDLRFDLPGSVDFDTDVTNQVYHPQGGGLQVGPEKSDIFAEGDSYLRGWVWQNKTNIEWSPSSETDLIYSFLDLNQQVCDSVNQKLLGNRTVVNSVLNFNRVLIGTGVVEDFLTADCTDCENVKSMCVVQSAGRRALYRVLTSR